MSEPGGMDSAWVMATVDFVTSDSHANVKAECIHPDSCRYRYTSTLTSSAVTTMMQTFELRELQLYKYTIIEAGAKSYRDTAL